MNRRHFLEFLAGLPLIGRLIMDMGGTIDDERTYYIGIIEDGMLYDRRLSWDEIKAFYDVAQNL